MIKKNCISYLQQKKHKTLMLLCTVLILCLGLTGCYDNTEIDKLAHVIAIGIDSGSSGQLKITMQFAIPNGDGGEKGDDKASVSKKAFYQTTVQALNIYDAINQIGTYLNKKIQFSHTEILVISEKLAVNGVKDIMETIAKNNVFRPNMYIAVSKGSSAEEYLENIIPVLESNPVKYYKLFHKAYEFSGVTSDTRLLPFMLRQQCTCTQAVAAIVSYVENNESIHNEARSVIKGLAVFHEDKMVGSLNERETLYYLLVSGYFKRGKLTFPFNEKQNQYVVLDLHQKSMPIVEVSTENINIDIEVSLEAELIALQNMDISDEEIDIKKIEEVVGERIKEEITNFLKKTSVTFNSDICALGKVAKGQFLTWENWTRFNWHSKYKDANFSINVGLKILNTGKK